MGCGTSRPAEAATVAPRAPQTPAAAANKATKQPTQPKLVAEKVASQQPIQKTASVAATEIRQSVAVSVAPSVKAVKEVEVSPIVVQQSFVHDVHAGESAVVEQVAQVQPETEAQVEDLQFVEESEAPMIAAFGEDGQIVAPDALAYQGSGANETFTPGADADAPETEYIMLPPGQLPPGMTQEDVPKEYLPEEQERRQREEEEARRVEAERKAEARQKALMGPSEEEVEEMLNNVSKRGSFVKGPSGAEAALAAAAAAAVTTATTEKQATQPNLDPSEATPQQPDQPEQQSQQPDPSDQQQEPQQQPQEQPQEQQTQIEKQPSSFHPVEQKAPGSAQPKEKPASADQHQQHHKSASSANVQETIVEKPITPASAPAGDEHVDAILETPQPINAATTGDNNAANVKHERTRDSGITMEADTAVA